jgi:serine/threonine protein kinase
MGSGYKRNASLRVIHRDIGASNCLLSQGKTRLEVRLDDFNKAHVIRRYERSSSSKNRMCTYQERYICGEDGRRPDVSFFIYQVWCARYIIPALE